MLTLKIYYWYCRLLIWKKSNAKWIIIYHLSFLQKSLLWWRSWQNENGVLYLGRRQLWEGDVLVQPNGLLDGTLSCYSVGLLVRNRLFCVVSSVGQARMTGLMRRVSFIRADSWPVFLCVVYWYFELLRKRENCRGWCVLCASHPINRKWREGGHAYWCQISIYMYKYIIFYVIHLNLHCL